MLPFLYGCTTEKEIYYSYQIGTYALDTAKKFIHKSNLISYGDYLLEFNTKMTISTIVHGDLDSTTISYDTMSVYLLSGTNRLYFEFDTFAINNTLSRVGKLTEKPFGFRFTFPPHDSTSDQSYAQAKKVVLNNINYFEAEIVSNDKTKNDSMQHQVILIKNKKFNSLYKMNGIKFPDGNYCIVGLYFYDLKNKGGILQQIESMRPLTEKEKDICAGMVKKSKSGVVDTTKKVSKG
jgi:hypothetical protein